MAWTARFFPIIKLGRGSRLLSVSSINYGSVIPFKLSDIGEGIKEVIVKEWFVKPGDKVSQFDNICEVQSDKASVTITSRYDGQIKALHYKVDDVALVGDALVDIELPDDNSQEVVGVNEETIATKKQEPIQGAANELSEVNKGEDNNNTKVLTTPAVRRLAAESNIDLKDVPATGKAGRVLKEDILAYLEAGKFIKPQNVDNRGANKSEERRDNEEIVPLMGYQKHMWKTMSQSRSIPHFVYSDECDVTKLLELRNESKDYLKTSHGISLSFTPFFVKATSKALEKYPRLNSWLDEQAQALKIFKTHNISLAMDTTQGLIVPNIKDVQNLGIIDIAKELNRLQALGQKAAFPIADVTGGTFTLSNIGAIGGTYAKPMILPPQIIIGVIGKVQKLPRFDNKGSVTPANIVCVSWAADHRVVDGATVARFSNQWKFYVENPHLLML
ncbi:lipoamide acyltransferase component of branched-chain alpha-keto acid dehydrogenase complex, mitochondrial [Microplitis demolitor]|uniref:lipoamide acyltransferase component of branched-chain alpha-keto acid dehydrogenase complex, mitochondrial n=1 Tax=Microplitis demolitor TaxID=69319 RepID=UPI0004CCA057|nr:lipoamide acyltransferase component of branched-chain alpha-keto acid dehydrogenase complex, mitochondrial [Microplitis demolitor]